MRDIIFTNPENTQGRIVHDYTDTGVPQETSGPIPPNAGDVREVYERLLADGVEPTPYTEPPVPAPQSITMRQLILGLATDDWITWPEAEAWADRLTLPAAVNAVIDQMPEEERPAARITAKTMSVAERDNPLLIGAAKIAEPEKSDEEIAEMIADAFTRWSEI